MNKWISPAVQRFGSLLCLIHSWCSQYYTILNTRWKLLTCPELQLPPTSKIFPNMLQLLSSFQLWQLCSSSCSSKNHIYSLWFYFARIPYSITTTYLPLIYTKNPTTSQHFIFLLPWSYYLGQRHSHLKHHNTISYLVSLFLSPTLS